MIRVADHAHICEDLHYNKTKELYVPRKWLCTNHHHKWHVLSNDMKDCIQIEPEEIDLYIDLLNEIIIINDQIPEELQDAYIDLYDNLYSTIEYNLERCSCSKVKEEMAIKTICDKEYTEEVWANEYTKEHSDVESNTRDKDRGRTQHTRINEDSICSYAY